MKNFSAIKGVSVAALLAVAVLGASAASAATYKFDTYLTGEDLGMVTLATLSVDQTGSDVSFQLTNTGAGGALSWLDYLKFNYSGTQTTFAATDTSPLDAWTVSVGKPNGKDAGLSFNLIADVSPNGSSKGLTSGQSTTFSIANVSAGDFLFANPNSLVHVGGLGLNGSKSAKYTVCSIASGTCGDDDGGVDGPSPVPLPAGLPMLLSALGLGVFLRKRKSA